jgi:tRNA pseudouridine-54 N-methylase
VLQAIESDSRIPGAPSPNLAPGRAAAIDLLAKCKPADAMFCTTDERRNALIELLACAYTLGRISGLRVAR